MDVLSSRSFVGERQRAVPGRYVRVSGRKLNKSRFSITDYCRKCNSSVPAARRHQENHDGRPDDQEYGLVDGKRTHAAVPPVHISGGRVAKYRRVYSSSVSNCRASADSRQ